MSQDPRTPEEKERDLQREAEEHTHQMFAEDMGASHLPGSGEVVVEEALEVIEYLIEEQGKSGSAKNMPAAIRAAKAFVEKARADASREASAPAPSDGAATETQTKMPFKEWVESIGENCLVLKRDDEGKYRAKIDKRGWFSGQWFDVPDDVEITPEVEQAYRGL